MEFTIYKITINDYIYVGSTKNYRHRKNDHNHKCNNPNGEKYNLLVYKTIRENGGWDNAIMSPVEILMCNKIIEARIKEEEWRVKLNANMNTQKCHLVGENQYEKSKKYREEQGESLLIKKLIHRNNNKDAINKHNREYRANMTEEQKEAQKIRRHQYYIDNMDKIRAKEKILHTCECGDEGLLCNLARHKKTKTHLDFVAGIERKVVESIACPCGSRYTKHNKNVHSKTKNHIQYLSTINI